MGETDDSNSTPHQGVRVPKLMWQAFGRVCDLRGVSRNVRIVDMIRSDIRRYGSEQDRADLAAANAELKARRSRKGTHKFPDLTAAPVERKQGGK